MVVKEGHCGANELEARGRSVLAATVDELEKMARDVAEDITARG